MRATHALFLLCFLLAFAACAPRAAPGNVTALDARFHANAREHGIPAQALLVLRNGELLYRNASGSTAVGGPVPVTSASVFPIYSVGKLFASTIALQLADEGALDLAAPASRYVPDLPPAWRSIRVDQLLSHVSGLPEYFDGADLTQPFPPSREAAFAALAKRQPVSAPGLQTRYTQTNYVVIGAVLEAVTRLPYRSLVRQRILEPLGMKETWIDATEVPAGRLVESYRTEAGRVVPEPAVAWPEYALPHVGGYLTVGDLGRFLSAVAQGRLVSKARLIGAWRPYRFDNGNTGFFATGWDYGESGRWREVGHDGGAKLRVRIVFDADLDEHYVIVYLTNGSKDGVWSRTLLDSIQALVVPK